MNRHIVSDPNIVVNTDRAGPLSWIAGNGQIVPIIVNYLNVPCNRNIISDLNLVSAENSRVRIDI
jgi:hypothetical protein